MTTFINKNIFFKKTISVFYGKTEKSACYNTFIKENKSLTRKRIYEHNCSNLRNDFCLCLMYEKDYDIISTIGKYSKGKTVLKNSKETK